MQKSDSRGQTSEVRRQKFLTSRSMTSRRKPKDALESPPYRWNRVTIASFNPQDHFPMQSVYKLPISMAVMQAVDAGKIKLSDKVAVTTSDMVGPDAFSQVRDRYPKGTSLTVEELLRYTLLISDGTTSDVLMRLAGG